MSKKFMLTWDEETRNTCWVYIEANSKKEALEKWNKGEFGDYERDEFSSTFSDEVDIEEVENE